MELSAAIIKGVRGFGAQFVLEVISHAFTKAADFSEDPDIVAIALALHRLVRRPPRLTPPDPRHLQQHLEFFLMRRGLLGDGDFLSERAGGGAVIYTPGSKMRHILQTPDEAEARIVGEMVGLAEVLGWSCFASGVLLIFTRKI